MSSVCFIKSAFDEIIFEIIRFSSAKSMPCATIFAEKIVDWALFRLPFSCFLRAHLEIRRQKTGLTLEEFHEIAGVVESELESDFLHHKVRESQ